MSIVLNGTTGITAPAGTLNRSGDGDIITLEKDGVYKGLIGINGNDPYFGRRAGVGITAQNNKIRPADGDDGSGYDNAVDLGEPSYRFKDLYLSGGVYVGGTGSANYLDDYEEGTWTPNVWHNSSNNSTWTVIYGFYRKIGSVVYCWFRLDGGNSGTAGSQLFLTGVPFTPDASNPSAGTFGIWAANNLTPQTGNIFWSSSNVFQIYNGGNGMTNQTSYISGFFSYNA